ncbi:MAG: biopolymer transporter ExbD [Desulfobacteraceae bacterium]|jgi:biopolymer transport protein ExbD
MKIHRVHTRPPRVEMLPLIDVVFLLLVVFIYAMLSMAVHKGMPVQLPSSNQIQREKEQPLSVTIESDGAIFLNKAPVRLEDLADVLKRQPGVDTETGVLLFADRQLRYQQLFDVLDRIRQAGLHRISLQAEASQ